jgi:predicted dehydrogenase
MTSSTGALRVGVVGAARGGGYITAIRAAGTRVVLEGVYDPSPSAAQAFTAEHGGPRSFETFESIVDACDALVIASPQQYHAPQAAFALRAGKHVLSEVPAVVSMEQAHELLAAARSSSATYMLSENYGYIRNNLVVGAMAAEGLFGDIYSGDAEYVHEMKAWHRTPDGHPTWRYHWQVGRNGVTYPTHSLGPLLSWMQDRVTAVSCVGTGRWTDPEHELEDSVTMLARTRRGALIRIRLDLLSNRPELWDYYAIQGTLGAYEAGRGLNDTAKVYLGDGRGTPEWEPLENHAAQFLPKQYATPPEGSGHWGSDAWPFLDFLDAVERGSRPPIDVYTALDMTLPGVVSEDSIAQGGAWLRVPDPRTLTAGIGIDPGREAPLA